MKSARIRTAFILGAGLGTRLRPLTEECPKPLLPVGGRPLITFAMDHCLTVGVERFIVNTHHCAAAYDRAFPERSWRGWPILFRHEPALLDTAGGIKNVEDLLDPGEPLLVYNGDVISDLALAELLAAHGAGGREVTLALRSRGGVRNVAVDRGGSVCDLRGILGNPGVRRCLFTGMYVLEHRFLGRLTAGRVESVVPVFAEMIREAPGSVGGVVIDAGLWRDIGDPAAYARIRQKGVQLRYDGAPASRGGLSAGEPSAAVTEGEAAAFVRAALGVASDAGISLVPVGQGGSDRSYHRGTVPGGGPFILMRYNRLREENNYYAGIARFLKEIGVAVPALFGEDPERGLLLMEDLGDEDLFSLRGAPPEIRRDLYEQTLRLAARLHAFPPERLPKAIRVMPGFSPELYRWERDYFREQCVGRVCGVALDAAAGEDLERELAALARRLLETPAVLVHRDLQSQNVMVRGGNPFLIDFQGMRQGSPFYDLGSLLYDPYVEIGEELRTDLLRCYYDLTPPPVGWESFRELFCLASAQRLMQALGAYGFLGLGKGKRHFLAHIPPALDRLIAVAQEAGTLPRLHALARRCRDCVAA